MKTLHIAPGYSAGGSLIRAIRDAGREDDVLSFADDLSCGPIDSDAARTIWRRELYDAPEIDTAVADFGSVSLAQKIASSCGLVANPPKSFHSFWLGLTASNGAPTKSSM